MKENWVVLSTVRRIIGRTRGIAVPLANGLLEQITQFISTGMTVEMALRESLLLAIHTARIKAQHCVGSERYALDDFIASCLAIRTLTE